MKKRTREDADGGSNKRTNNNNNNVNKLETGGSTTAIKNLQENIMKSISLLDTFKQTFYTNIQDVSIEKKEKELERSSSSSSSQNVNAHDTLTNELTDAIINFDVALNNINKLAEDGIPNEVTIPTKMLKEFDGMYSTSFTVGIVGKLLECKERLEEGKDTKFILRDVKRKSLNVD